MLQIVVHMLVTAGLLMVVSRIVSGIEVEDGMAALKGALVLGLANAFLRPLLVVLTLPLTVLTLGLFVFILNALMLMLAASFVRGFKVNGFGAALWGSVLLGVLNLAVAWIFGI